MGRRRHSPISRKTASSPRRPPYCEGCNRWPPQSDLQIHQPRSQDCQLVQKKLRCRKRRELTFHTRYVLRCDCGACSSSEPVFSECRFPKYGCLQCRCRSNRKRGTLESLLAEHRFLSARTASRFLQVSVGQRRTSEHCIHRFCPSTGYPSSSHPLAFGLGYDKRNKCHWVDFQLYEYWQSHGPLAVQWTPARFRADG